MTPDHARFPVEPQPRSRDGELPADCVAIECSPGLWCIQSRGIGPDRHIASLLSGGMPMDVAEGGRCSAHEYWREWFPYGVPGDDGGIVSVCVEQDAAGTWFWVSEFETPLPPENQKTACPSCA